MRAGQAVADFKMRTTLRWLSFHWLFDAKQHGSIHFLISKLLQPVLFGMVTENRPVKQSPLKGRLFILMPRIHFQPVRSRPSLLEQFGIETQCAVASVKNRVGRQTRQSAGPIACQRPGPRGHRGHRERWRFVKDLSGSERNQVHLVKLLRSSNNVLLLDRLTNLNRPACQYQRGLALYQAQSASHPGWSMCQQSGNSGNLGNRISGISGQFVDSTWPLYQRFNQSNGVRRPCKDR